MLDTVRISIVVLAAASQLTGSLLLALSLDPPRLRLWTFALALGVGGGLIVLANLNWALINYTDLSSDKAVAARLRE